MPDASSPQMQHDKPATIDQLGYSPYIMALADMLSGDALHTPVTVGVYGPWGTGKSTFMRLLSREMVDRKNPHCLTFEAWQFDGKEEVWKALVLTVIRYLETKTKEEMAQAGNSKEIKRGLTKLIKGVTRIALNQTLKNTTGGAVTMDKLVDFWAEEKNDNTKFLNSFRETFSTVREKSWEKATDHKTICLSLLMIWIGVLPRAVSRFLRPLNCFSIWKNVCSLSALMETLCSRALNGSIKTT